MITRCAFVFVLVLLAASVVCAQKVDQNKFAVIINGPGGEPAYAKQFDEWTKQLSGVLAERFGFDSKNVKVLSEKSATAEEVKRTFATLKSQLDANNVLYLFLRSEEHTSEPSQLVISYAVF